MRWANTYVGIPWLEKGRTRAGCDCYGLVRLALAEVFALFLDAEDQFYHSTALDCEAIQARFQQVTTTWPWQPVTPPHTPQAGDVAIFVLARKYWHCGLLVTPSEVLHVREGCDAVIEPLAAPWWARRLEGIYRHGD